jgi:hypothetical protein
MAEKIRSLEITRQAGGATAGAEIKIYKKQQGSSLQKINKIKLQLQPGSRFPSVPRITIERLNDSSDEKQAYLAALFLAASFLAVTAGVTLLAGLDFPKDPLKIFPFFVFLSPLPIIIIF